MEDIAKMADECMRNMDEDDDEDDVEDDEDLLVCHVFCAVLFCLLKNERETCLVVFKQSELLLMCLLVLSGRAPGSGG